MKMCGRCDTRRAEHRSSDLPDIVGQDFGWLCADCHAELAEQAELLGLAS